MVGVAAFEAGEAHEEWAVEGDPGLAGLGGLEEGQVHGDVRWPYAVIGLEGAEELVEAFLEGGGWHFR